MSRRLIAGAALMLLLSGCSSNAADEPVSISHDEVTQAASETPAAPDTTPAVDAGGDVGEAGETAEPDGNQAVADAATVLVEGWALGLSTVEKYTSLDEGTIAALTAESSAHPSMAYAVVPTGTIDTGAVESGDAHLELSCAYAKAPVTDGTLESAESQLLKTMRSYLQAEIDGSADVEQPLARIPCTVDVNDGKLSLGAQP